ncbi:dihydroorotase [Moraxella nasovis]|uniref:dihydroorotase n=1 Tax=Moraxella nasovis TaxID=2904121 RepID=UPI001F61239E|nr:dihydroorotase [Moraxella nasovis]UNU72832.1 dihydroorotase [Moraxella nasovis]
MKNLLPKTWQFDTKNITTDTNEKWLIPPIVDLCARLNKFGDGTSFTHECQTAIKNGILHVCTPPDDGAVRESSSLLKEVREKAANHGLNLHMLGALTQGLKGEKLANIADIKAGGAIGVSNARFAFANDEVLLRALEYAKAFDIKVFFYPDEPSLSKGVAHDGYIASYHGLAGIPWLAETVALAKQILMVEETGICAHFSQLTCRTSVDLVRFGKARGLPITCDVAMHQLFLTDDDIEGYNANAHVYPPLRSNTDQRALRQGLADGTIDAICSHHEPLSSTDKLMPFAESVAGISNFDTFVSLACQLVADGVLTDTQLVEKICLNPANIAGITDYEQIGGAVLIDPNQAWQVTKQSILSKGKNTPFLGDELFGKVVQTFF